METSIFAGGSILAAVVAGSIALFAPCCISVMLPAYLAGSVQNRLQLTAMTIVYGLGVATVVLPVTLGVATLLPFIVSNHTGVYVVGGLLMLGLGIFTLAGGSIRLPSPSMPGRSGSGPAAVYSLGVFSGIASSCCAPVLAGLIALSGLSGTPTAGLELGAAYVFGMVAPLFIIALLWEAYDWRSSRLFRPRLFAVRRAGRTMTITGSQLASGALLLVMGGATIWAGLTRQAMEPGARWQSELSVTIQGWGDALVRPTLHIPNFVFGVVILAAFLLLLRRAARQLGWWPSPPGRFRPNSQPTLTEEDENEQFPVAQASRR